MPAFAPNCQELVQACAPPRSPSPDPKDARKLVPLAVDLSPAFKAGLIYPCDLEGEEELAYFVQLATTLDDSEAACLAIPKVRKWGLATDDQIARREAIQHGVQVVTTPELVKMWAAVQSIPVAEVARVLQNIRTFSRFEPHGAMPLHDWWFKTVGE